MLKNISLILFCNVYSCPYQRDLANTYYGLKVGMIRGKSGWAYLNLRIWGGAVMDNVKADGTDQCAHDDCSCKVADEENHVKTAAGIFCCQECSEGKGCNHPGCSCGSKIGS